MKLNKIRKGYLAMETTTSQDKTDELHSLLQALANKSGVVREESRNRLVQLGGADVTRSLVELLVDLRKQVRWEAAIALVAIRDPVSAPALLNALEDEDEDVRWIAAQGLTALGRLGLVAVLDGLKKRAKSPEFCHSAHHVLHDLKQSEYDELIKPVLEALEHEDAATAVPLVAYEALLALATTTTDANS